MNQRHFWTLSETQFALANRGKMTTDEIAERIGRSNAAVMNFFKRHTQPQRAAFTPWTAAELDVIVKNYETHGATWCAAQLPGRSKSSCASRAQDLGIRHDRKQPRPQMPERISVSIPLVAIEYERKAPIPDAGPARECQYIMHGGGMCGERSKPGKS